MVLWCHLFAYIYFFVNRDTYASYFKILNTLKKQINWVHNNWILILLKSSIITLIVLFYTYCIFRTFTKLEICHCYYTLYFLQFITFYIAIIKVNKTMFHSKYNKKGKIQCKLFLVILSIQLVFNSLFSDSNICFISSNYFWLFVFMCTELRHVMHYLCFYMIMSI